MKIAPFPELTTYAEEEARAFYGALPPMSPQRTPRPVRRMTTTTEPGWDVVGSETTTWEEQSEEWRSAIVAAYVALLTDLSRPASQWIVQKYVAERHGAATTYGVTMRRRLLTDQAAQWSICAADGSDIVCWGDELNEWANQYPMRLTPAQRADPAEALAAIVAALWGGS